jgi:hypothetical protein
MTDVALLGPWLRRFLLEHLIGERNLARNPNGSSALALIHRFGYSFLPVPNPSR